MGYEVWGRPLKRALGSGHGAYAPLKYEVIVIGNASGGYE